jgi:Zn-dependent alcohol dehydrogenase
VFSFVPVCGHCLPCSEGRAALCENGAKVNVAGSLLTGKRHFHNARGDVLHHHLGVSGFSELTVAARESLVKIDPEYPIGQAALFGCAVLTGVGAVVNTAQVSPGTSVAVFGMGGVGLSAVMGARAAGADPIIAVDMLDAKLELAKEIGATHVVNSAKTDAVEAIGEITKGGARYAFEAVGNAKVLELAYKSTRRGGTTVTIGLAHPQQLFSIPAVSLVAEERTILGSYMGSAVPARDIPRFINMHKAGLLPVEKLFSKNVQLEQLNEAFDDLHHGIVVRQLLTFH